MNQLGWRSRIQSIIVESELIKWYDKALRGGYSELMGDKLISVIREEIVLEFPTSDNSEFNEFYYQRGYNKISDEFWK